MMSREACAVANWTCTAAANFEGADARATCVVCDRTVCADRNCSRVVRGAKTRRWCVECLEEEGQIAFVPGVGFVPTRRPQ